VGDPSSGENPTITEERMAKSKSIRDNSNAVLPASNGLKPESSNRIVLTDANAPLLAAKFLEGILLELKKLNEKFDHIEKANNG